MKDQKRVPDRMFIGISLGLLCLEVMVVLLVGWVAIKNQPIESETNQIAVDY